MPAKKSSKSSSKKNAANRKAGGKQETSLSSSRHNIMDGIISNWPKRGAKSASKKSAAAKKTTRKKESSLSSLSMHHIIMDGWSVEQFLQSTATNGDGYTAVFLINPLESTKEALRVAWPETCLACGHWFDFPAAAVESVIPLGVEECCATPFPKVGLRIKKQYDSLIEMLRAHLAGNLGSEMMSAPQAPAEARGRGFAAAVSVEEEMCASDGEAEPRAMTARGTMDAAAATTLELSGAHWVARFPGSRSIFDTKPPFLDKVSKFHAALLAAGAAVRISATFRPPERAHLMHFSLKISKGQIDPRSVPAMAGVNIQWWHGDLARSKSAAAAMVSGYGIAFPPALRSRHTEGLAIDMTITWSGTLNIKDATGAVKAVGSPRNGKDNTTLHRVGATYGVIKLVTDAPHWSNDGH
ncbi:MAG TPA: hypothetical protein VF666_14010 [Pyrinomonadaceae bacterium]|jgi:hypothetical protein